MLWLRQRLAERPELFLFLLAAAMPLAFRSWQALLNNFAIERAGFTGVEIGILQSLREIPGFLAFTVVFVLLLVREQTLAVLSLVGVVNIPIIHYSVVWWNTLHQGATIMRLDGPAIDESMRWPLFAMIGAFYLYYFIVLMIRACGEILNRESRSRWVRELAGGA